MHRNLALRRIAEDLASPFEKSRMLRPFARANDGMIKGRIMSYPCFQGPVSVRNKALEPDAHWRGI